MNDYINLERCVTGFSLDNQYIDCISNDSVIKIDRDTKKVVHSTKLFKKEGFSRDLIANDNFLFIRDFFTLYILDKVDYSCISTIQLGTDLKTDICGMTIDKNNIYACIRNGKISVIDIDKHTIKGTYQILHGSVWDLRSYNNILIGGSVNGELFFLDNSKLVIRNKLLLGTQNIGSVLLHENYVYAAGQDKALYIVDISSRKCIKKKRNVHNRMFDCAAIYKDVIITISYPLSVISFWDKDTLEFKRSITIPLRLSGRTVLENDTLYIASRNINGIVSLNLN